MLLRETPLTVYVLSGPSFGPRAHTMGRWVHGPVPPPPIRTWGPTEAGDVGRLRYDLKWRWTDRESQTETSQATSNLKIGSSFGLKGPHVGLRGPKVDLGGWESLYLSDRALCRTERTKC